MSSPCSQSSHSHLPPAHCKLQVLVSVLRADFLLQHQLLSEYCFTQLLCKQMWQAMSTRSDHYLRSMTSVQKIKDILVH